VKGIKGTNPIESSDSMTKKKKIIPFLTTTNRKIISREGATQIYSRFCIYCQIEKVSHHTELKVFNHPRKLNTRVEEANKLRYIDLRLPYQQKPSHQNLDMELCPGHILFTSMKQKACPRHISKNQIQNRTKNREE